MLPGKLDSIPIYKHQFIEEGVFDVKKVFGSMLKWFGDHGYGYQEKDNTTNKKPKGTEIKYEGIADKDINDYIRYEIRVTFLAIELEEVDYKDKKLHRGKWRINIYETMHMDYRHKWAKTKFSRFLKFIYNNYIVKHKILGEWAGGLKFETDDLIDTIKGELEMIKL